MKKSGWYANADADQRELAEYIRKLPELRSLKADSPEDIGRLKDALKASQGRSRVARHGTGVPEFAKDEGTRINISESGDVTLLYDLVVEAYKTEGFLSPSRREFEEMRASK